MGDGVGVLAGKVAIVTGGGSGIGRGIALEFGREGASIVVASRRQSAIDGVAQEIRERGGAALGIACDVRDEVQVQSMVARTVEAFGPVDILVNAAQGFSGGLKDEPTRYALESFPDDEWDYLFQSGLKGSLYAMKAVFPYMRERGGKIINFGSEVGQKGGAQFAAYAANKEAIRALSRSAAREWGPHGINVNVINPVIETEQSSWTSNPEMRAQVLASTCLRRVAKPEEAGRVAVFLAGPDSDYLTGMTFMVDGGRFLFA
jgi:2-hydroxycyclohexanecarboxyl-CoA dehydrogenase